MRTGKPYIEQHLVAEAPQFSTPLFITGDPEWSDYTVEVKVKPLALNRMAGVVFRYHTNRHYYLFVLEDGKRARLALHLPLEKALRVRDWKELASAPFTYDAQHYYTLKVENIGPRIRAYVDGKLRAGGHRLGDGPKGKAGLTATVPARFQDFRVTRR